MDKTLMVLFAVLAVSCVLCAANDDPVLHPDCPPDENPQHPTHLPYPGDCTKFYKCNAGWAYPMDCPPGLHWSVAFDRCEWPEVAKCEH